MHEPTLEDLWQLAAQRLSPDAAHGAIVLLARRIEGRPVE